MTTSAQKLDRHVLYQLSVQNPEFEARFIRKVYKKERGKDAKLFREDFCGTAILACEWVRRVSGGEAIGLDLDEPTLEWGREHNIAKLGKKASRVRLINRNVLDAAKGSEGETLPDVVAAFNFSYFIFKDRNVLLDYFRAVYNSSADDAIFFLDLYGGPESQVAQEEPRIVDEDGHDEFTYVWDQYKYNPITGETVCHIHFDDAEGEERLIRRAFTYEWRLWSLPEVQDLLRDAGFREVHVYWEGTDKDGEGSGVFRRSVKGDDSVSWIVYIVAVK